MVFTADDGEGLIQVLFQERGEDEADNKYRRIKSSHAHAVSHHRKDDQDQDVVHVLACGEGTGKGKDRHAGEDVVATQRRHLHEELEARACDAQQEQIGDQEAGKDRVDSLRVLEEDHRARCQTVDQEGPHQQRSHIITGNTQGQHGDHAGATDGVIGRFSGSDTFHRALGILLRFLRGTLGLAVSDKGRSTGSQTWQRADKGTDTTGFKDGRKYLSDTL